MKFYRYITLILSKFKKSVWQHICSFNSFSYSERGVGWVHREYRGQKYEGGGERCSKKGSKDRNSEEDSLGGPGQV